MSDTESSTGYRSRHASTFEDTKSAGSVLDEISNGAFQTWFRERNYAENIRNGTPYYNGPPSITPPEKHSPGSLLQCQRRTTYQELNAPEETPDPEGIYWVGSRFEEDVVLPFIQDEFAGEGEYVTNSMWVDFEVETTAGELRVKGATDPVIVNRESEPQLLFEIKTKQSVENLESPDEQHRAQVHAYMRGLSEEYDQTVSEAIILYGDRTTFDITPFLIEFDHDFWQDTVLNWAASQTVYRLDEELPSAEPEREWECDYCPYRERCGKGGREFSDIGPTGLLPRYTGYSRQKLIDYLESYSDAQLTPSLAHQHPDLATKYGVLDWECNRCGKCITWEAVEWDGDITSPPSCPACSPDTAPSLLSAPHPEDQLSEPLGHGDG